MTTFFKYWVNTCEYYHNTYGYWAGEYTLRVKTQIEHEIHVYTEKKKKEANFLIFWANYEKRTRKQDASLPCIVCCTLRALFSLYAKFLRRFNVIWAKWQTMHRQKLRVMISHFMTCQELHPFQPKILSLLGMESGHNFIKGIIWQKSQLIFHFFIYAPSVFPSALNSFSK